MRHHSPLSKAPQVLLRLCAVAAAAAALGCGGSQSSAPSSPNGELGQASGADGKAGPGDVVRLRSDRTKGHIGASILWSQTTGPTVSLSDPTEEEPTFIAPIVTDAVALNLSFRMRLTTSAGSLVTDDVGVTVQPANTLLFLADVDGSSGAALFAYRPDTGRVTGLSGPTVDGGGVETWHDSPDQRTIAYRGDVTVVNTDEVFAVDIAAGAPLRISQEPDLGGQVTRGEWAPDGSRFSFLGDLALAGREDAFSVLPTASDVQSIAPSTLMGGDMRELVWTPSSERVIVRGEMAAASQFEVFSADPDGTASARLHPPLTAGGSISQMQVTPDGSLVVMRGDAVTDGRDELFVCAPDGSGLTSLAVPLVAGGSVRYFRISPDGEWIGYVADGDTDEVIELYTIRVDGSAQSKVTPTPVTGGDVYTFFDWTPDSQRIVFEGDLAVANQEDLQSVRPDGSDLTVLVSQPDASSYLTQWNVSPSSGYIAVQMSRAGGELDFGIVSVDGSAPYRVLGQTYNALFHAAEWVSDGSRFVTNCHHESVGDDHLYSAAPEDLSLTRISGPVVAGSYVADFNISPDGRFVAYTLDEDDDSRYEGYVVPIAGGPRVQVTPEGPGASSSLDLTWSRDSQWLGIRGDSEVALEFRVWVCRATGADLRPVPLALTPEGDAWSARWFLVSDD